MKLRWLIKKHPEPTIQEIRAFWEKNCVSLSEAKRMLKKPSTRELQYFVPSPIYGECGEWESHEREKLGEWVTVPEVIEEVE